MKKQPTAPSVAEFYHEQTVYSPQTISALNPDLSARPQPFKQYLSEQSVDLRPMLGQQEVADSGDGEVASSDESLLGRISRLLYFTCGITHIQETPQGPIYRRAAPSAGALYPSEVYLAARDADGLTDGIHSYQAANHTLVPVLEGDFGLDIEESCFRHAATLRARVILMVTAMFSRSSWRYLERAYRRILLDSGHVLGNIVAYAPHERFDAVTVAGFCDDALNQLLFLDSREEAAFLVVPLIERGESRRTRINSAFPLPSRRHVHEADRLSDQGVMQLLHERSSIVPDQKLTRGRRSPSDTGRNRLGDESVSTIDLPETARLSHLPDVIVQRRSTRKFACEGISLSKLGGILHYAYAPARLYYDFERGVRVQDCCFLDPTILDTIVLIHQVDGVPPGIYDLDPRDMTLTTRREGEFREAFGYACLGQELGRDAAAVVIHIANLERAVKRYGDRAYRYLHLDAGHLGQRMNLAATFSRIGVSGIAGFFDEELAALLELPKSCITVYITALGQPERE